MKHTKYWGYIEDIRDIENTPETKLQKEKILNLLNHMLDTIKEKDKEIEKLEEAKK